MDILNSLKTLRGRVQCWLLLENAKNMTNQVRHYLQVTIDDIEIICLYSLK